MITYAEYTDVGNREKNEDSIGSFLTDAGGLFILADGLGGHGRGEYASSSVVRTGMQIYHDNTEGFQLSDCFDKCQEVLLREQEENPELYDMKTTMVALQINDSVAKWAHVGDSRLYCFKKRKLLKRTLDHSVPQMLVAMGEITEKDIRFHEDRNRLLRVMGSEGDDKNYTLSDELKLSKSYEFLLCSDGFWENILEDDMVDTLKRANDVDEWMRLMVEIVKTNGNGTNMDNNSAIAVWVEKE
ncbi:Serine/threonine protein phosphatase PrpC [Eubacterium ruminantium]|nr:Serine/threonine protein phosphatase PrpC [Eubacterium ruminantium]